MFLELSCFSSFTNTSDSMHSSSAAMSTGVHCPGSAIIVSYYWGVSCDQAASYYETYYTQPTRAQRLGIRGVSKTGSN